MMSKHSSVSRGPVGYASYSRERFQEAIQFGRKKVFSYLLNEAQSRAPAAQVQLAWKCLGFSPWLASSGVPGELCWYNWGRNLGRWTEGHLDSGEDALAEGASCPSFCCWTPWSVNSSSHNNGCDYDCNYQLLRISSTRYFLHCC